MLNDEWVEFLSKREIVMLILLFYVGLSKKLFAGIRDTLNIKPDGKLLRIFMVAHNAFLCIFSLWVTVNTWPTLVSYALENGIAAVHLDKKFWELISYWSTIFFISKYYEFIDSWILVLKGVEPSYLQVYHHTGVVIAMWLGIQNQSNWLIFMVCLNSFIHTLMYFYYVFSVCGYKSKHAKKLTMMQLTQFVAGIVLSGYSFFLDVSNESKYALVFMHTYAVGLIYLFHAMSKEKYGSKESSKKGN